MIEVSNITKRYGDVTALQELNLSIPAGSIFGLLGPNGAGKTTLLRLIVGLLAPDQGDIQISGCQRHQIGYLPESPHFPGRFRIREFLRVSGQTSGLSGRQLDQAVTGTLEQVGLSHVNHWRISACSKGMLQRLGVAQALVTDPPILLLDEPLSGLDPAAQSAMRYLTSEMAKAGKTVVLSTHRLSDVTQMATHIAILTHGRLARYGLLSEVLNPQARVIIRVERLPELVVWQLQQLDPAIEVSAGGSTIILPDKAAEQKSVALRLLLDARIDVLHMERQHSTLEDIYLEAVHS